MLSRHPWGFSGAVDRVEGRADSGDLVRVETSNGRFVAWAIYNPASRTPLRLVEWDENRRVDEQWWNEKVATAISGRSALIRSHAAEGLRLIHGEADGLPGLVCDLYGEIAVVQLSTAGADQRRRLIADTIVAAAVDHGIALRSLYERSESDVRILEGLAPAAGLLWGEPPPERVVVREGAVRLVCSVTAGQKGGLYFDQRDNRATVARYCRGARILDCFCYTGAFSGHALAEGATHSTMVDSSRPALELAEETMRENGFAGDRWTTESGDLFRLLRDFRAEGRSYDVVILDPPKLAPTRAAVEGALRGYKDLNLTALSLIRKGGLLATFSCSGRVSREQFRTAVTWAAADSGRDVQILETFSQAADHPVRLSFPESEYLKGYLLRLVS